MAQHTTTPECPTVKPLSQQCLHYIAMHLEEFPVSQLVSLLPVKTREELLWRLPIADLCQLEDTEFVTGIQDMVAYWKKPCEEFAGMTVPDHEDTDIKQYIKEWDELEYAREFLYGWVTTIAYECQGVDFCFKLPNGELMPSDDSTVLLEFFYAVRNLYDQKCDLVFPPRYSQHKGQDTPIDVDAIISCFKEELPKVFAAVIICEYDHEDKLEYAEILGHAVFVGFHVNPFEGIGLKFVQEVIKLSLFGHLEVLVFEGLSFSDERTSLDDLCSFMSSYPMFWSTIRILKFLKCGPAGYTITQRVFDQLITAYFSAHTDQVQKVHFFDTKMKYTCEHPPCSLNIDQRYLQYKTIELDHCEFVSKSEATPKAISHWLGQDIQVLQNNEGSCVFRVKEKVNTVGKKRKFSEVVYCN